MWDLDSIRLNAPVPSASRIHLGVLNFDNAFLGRALSECGDLGQIKAGKKTTYFTVWGFFKDFQSIIGSVDD